MAFILLILIVWRRLPETVRRRINPRFCPILVRSSSNNQQKSVTDYEKIVPDDRDDLENDLLSIDDELPNEVHSYVKMEALSAQLSLSSIKSMLDSVDDCRLTSLVQLRQCDRSDFVRMNFPKVCNVISHILAIKRQL